MTAYEKCILAVLCLAGLAFFYLIATDTDAVALLAFIGWAV